MDPRRSYDRVNPFFRSLLLGATAFALWLIRVKVTVEGREKLPAGRFVMVCNHVSNYDPLVTWHGLSDKTLAFISKPENFNIFLFGRIIRRCGFMAIDRENPRKAVKTVKRAVSLLTEDEASVVVYPEGTRSKSGELLPFHNSVFKIPQQAKVPLVVATVHGTRRIVPFRGTTVTLKIRSVLPTEFLAENRTDAIGETVRSEMLKEGER